MDAGPGEPVPLITIDGLNLRDCQFIKLNIEGMETEALRGAAATIGRFRPILYVENDRQARSAPLIGLVQSYGYRLYWHLPPLWRADNFRADTEDIFGGKVSVNMICIPAEIPQQALTNIAKSPAQRIVSSSGSGDPQPRSEDKHLASGAVAASDRHDLFSSRDGSCRFCGAVDQLEPEMNIVDKILPEQLAAPPVDWIQIHDRDFADKPRAQRYFRGASCRLRCARSRKITADLSSYPVAGASVGHRS